MAAFTLMFGICFFCFGMILAGKIASRPVTILLYAVAVFLSAPACLYILYYAHIFDGAAWYYNLRIRPYTELLPSGLGFLSGILFASWKPESLAEKATLPFITLLALLIPYAKPLLDPLNYAALNTSCPGEVCLQSTPSTCGPSSAATILKMYGGTTSEEELAEVSFTSHGGTEIWYLARALQRRGYVIRTIIQPTVLPLPPLPAIAGVTLPGGAGHFIAVLSENNGQVKLADPLKGKLEVPTSDLRKAYHFTGFFLAVQPSQRMKVKIEFHLVGNQ